MNRFFCLLCLAALAAGLGNGTGCSRQYYRQKADHEVYSLLQQGSNDPRWKLDNHKMSPNAASRLFDPFNPDREPMPTDDPTAHRRMHYVNGKKGSSQWYSHGKTSSVENPHWRQFLLVNEKGEIPLDKEQAVDLSILHSPEYRSAIENLYLAAMDVSRERFVYDVQFYGGDSIFYTALGRNRGSDTIRNSASLGAEKALATGGTWVAELANSITWSLTGQSSWNVNTSLLNVSLVQPLLRGANRKVVLERLTQSERNFLAEIRRMVLFQQGHYTRIVAGTGPSFTSGPSGTSRAAAPSSGGFYSLLSGQIQIQNQRQNIIRLEENLNRFIAMFDAGQVTDAYQIEEMRQNLFTSQSSLLRQINTYQSNIESYIRSLGLPPDLKVSISDPLLEQFQLTSPTLTTLMEDVGDILAVIRKKDQPLSDHFQEEIEEIVQRTKGEMIILEQDLETLQKSVPARLEGLKNLEALLAHRTERIDPRIYESQFFEERVEKLRKDIPQNLSRLQAVFTLLDLIAQSEEQALRQMIMEHSFDPPAKEALELLQIHKTADGAKAESETWSRQKELEAAIDQLKAMQDAFEVEQPQELPTAREVRRAEARKVIAELRQKDEYRDWIHRVFSTYQHELVSLSLMQTRARLDAMTLTPVSITAEAAFQTASEHRLDWMNQKSRLVDRWRQIDIAADRLKGDLKLTLSGDAGSIDRQGVHFGADSSRLQANVEWTSPLTRHREMMDYRASQIAYQAARRDYYTYVDSVQADLRNIVRMVEMCQINFEINRNAVLVGTIRVDVMQLRMEQPPNRGARIDTNVSDQLIRALDGLMTSQNNLLNAWVDYQTQRMLLDLNMGTMALDDRGHWIDPGMLGAALKGVVLQEAVSKKGSETPGVVSLPVTKLEIPRLNRRYVEEEEEP